MANDNIKVELMALLKEAEQLAGEFTGGYSSQFLSAEEFHQALVISIDKLKEEDQSQLKQLCLWFAPTCSWDDFIGIEGQDLANRIYAILWKMTSV